MKKKTVLEGQKYTIPNNKFIAPSNKEFFGWKDQNNNFYSPGDIITLNNSKQLYAIWVNQGSILTKSGTITRLTGTTHVGGGINREYIKINDGFSFACLVYYKYDNNIAATPLLIGFDSSAVDNRFVDSNGYEAHLNSPSNTFNLYSKDWVSNAGAGFLINNNVNNTNLTSIFGDYNNPLVIHDGESDKEFIDKIAKAVLNNIIK